MSKMTGSEIANALHNLNKTIPQGSLWRRNTTKKLYIVNGYTLDVKTQKFQIRYSYAYSYTYPYEPIEFSDFSDEAGRFRERMTYEGNAFEKKD